MNQFARFVLLGLLLVAMPALAANWPKFRGPDGNGLSAANGIPTHWGNETNIRWQVDLPGQGWSAPIVWDGKVYVTTATTDSSAGDSEAEYEAAEPPSGEQRRGPRGEGRRRGGVGRRIGRGGGIPDSVRWEVHCLDLATGDTLWTHLAKEGKPTISTHHQNTYASETPVTDGKHIYVYFGMTGLYCYDMGGKPVWEKDLGTYEMEHGWGTSSSPVLAGDLLIQQVDSEEQSFLIALDKHTGDERWRVEREEPSNWSTPLLWENTSRTELVVGGRVFRSYEPSTGDLLWQLDPGGGRSSASPTANREMLIVGTENRANRGQGAGGLFAVRAGAAGDITPTAGESTSSGVMWSHPDVGPPMASPLIYEGFVYTLDRRGGFVTCYHAASGEREYRERVEGARAFWASPWAADGKVFLQDDTGTTHVIKPGPEYEVFAANEIDDTFWASSALADGAIVLRGVKGVYCVAAE